MTTEFSAQAKAHAVKVMNGSGVLMPAKTTEYSYIFTARHNLARSSENLLDLLSLKDIVISDKKGNTYSPSGIYFSDSEDAAVLLVQQLSADPLAFSNDIVSAKASIWLVGYPNVRRKESDPLRLFTGEIEDIQKHGIDISTSTFDLKDQLMGVSGGGVYQLVDQKLILVGIEYGMEAYAKEEHSWLRCVRINVFEEIISKSTYQDRPLASLSSSFVSEHYAKQIRHKYFNFNATKVPKASRIFLIDMEGEFEIDEAATMLMKLAEFFSHKEHTRTTDQDRFAPYVLLRGIQESHLIGLKSKLWSGKVKFSDGYPFLGSNFFADILVLDPTKENLCRLKFITYEDQLVPTIVAIAGRSIEVYDLYKKNPLSDTLLPKECTIHPIKCNSSYFIHEVMKS